MALKVLIVEDEPMAQANLSRTLQKYYPDLEIIGTTSSVSGTVEWLKGHSVDVIFMDVELSDGDCFSIFRQINVDAKIVMTTAYDSYAVKAFEVNSVDYLLKPIEKEDLDRAVQGGPALPQFVRSHGHVRAALDTGRKPATGRIPPENHGPPERQDPAGLRQ